LGLLARIRVGFGERIESGEVPGPRIRSTGEVLVAAGAMPLDTVIRALGYMTVRHSEITDAAQATAASRTLLDAGTDGIKVPSNLLLRPIRRFQRAPFEPP
jgi:hypothetical protein